MALPGMRVCIIMNVCANDVLIACRFVDGGVNHFSGIFGPGGAMEGPVDFEHLARM